MFRMLRLGERIALLGALLSAGCSPQPAARMAALAACAPEHKGKRVEIAGEFGGGESTITVSNGRATLRFDQGTASADDLYVEVEVGEERNQFALHGRRFTANDLTFRLDDNRVVGVRQPIVLRGVVTTVTSLPAATLTGGRHPYVCTITTEALMPDTPAPLPR